MPTTRCRIRPARRSRANLKLCRTHRLIKTFYCGPGGWSERQAPDSTVVFTSPTGHRYTTDPGRPLPALSVPTGEPVAATVIGSVAANRGLAMPTRSGRAKQTAGHE